MNEDIAIVGIGCRYPGGIVDIESFWELLKNKKDPIISIPEQRWNNTLFLDDNKKKPGKHYVREGGFLSDIHCFDADFFKILPREASHIDPQQRLLLETSYHALQNAKIGMHEIKASKTGVYVGVYIHDYQHLELSNLNEIDAYSGTGTAMSISANRLSYYFDLKGPSLAVDTACSSSLVAVHLACQSLKDGSTDMGIAAGVNAILKPEMTIAMAKANMLSPDGRSKSFDASANGFVRSEGVGVLILKRLSDALENGDPIHGVIKSSRVNSDGATKGISVPNGSAQEAIFKEILQDSGLKADDIDYVEAHGTGTPVGDPIELNAIGNVFGRAHNKTKPLHVGSVKSNIGHTESASGIAGIIKTCLSIKNNQIAPNLHFKTPNPEIRFSENNIKINTELEPWPKTTKKRALVNSFGFGGTNASVIIEQAPEVEPIKSGNKTAYIAPFSAHNANTLTNVLENFNSILAKQENSADVCRDISWSLAPFANDCLERMAFVYSSVEQLKDQIQQAINTPITKNKNTPDYPEICFVFSGMGSQWPTMAQQLFSEEGFMHHFRSICKQFEQKYNLPLWEEFTLAKSESQIDETVIAQPAIFTLQAALFNWLQDLGIKPKCIVGHSVGEIAAAYAAGVLSLEDAIQIIYYRSQLQQRTAGMGKLLAVGTDYENCKSIIGDMSDIDVAAFNGPSNLTLAGSDEKLKQIQDILTQQDIFAKFVRVDVPYHSRFMDCLKDEYFQAIQNIKPQKPAIKFISSIIGEESDYTTYDASYWWRNIRDSVKFSDSIFSILEHDCPNFLEIGGHPVLSTAINECLMHKKISGVCIPTLRRDKDDYQSILESLGRLYQLGVNFDFKSIVTTGNFIDLPLYPFQKQEYWVDTARNVGAINYFSSAGSDEVLGAKLPGHFDTWRSFIDLNIDKYLLDHKVMSSTVYPGAGYLNLMLHACKFVTHNDYISLYNISFKKMLTLAEDGEATEIQICVDNNHHITIANHEKEEGWEENAIASYSTNKAVKFPFSFDDIATDDFRKTYSKEFIYLLFENMGLFYGNTFQGIKNIKVGDCVSLAEIEVPEEIKQQSDYIFHPALLDCALHTIFGALSLEEEESHRCGEVYLPVSIDEINFYASPDSDTLYSFARITDKSLNSFTGDIFIFDSDKNLIARISNVTCRILSKRREGQLTEHHSKMMYEYSWKEIPAPTQTSDVNTVLMLINNHKAGNKIADKVRSQGCNIISIRPITEKTTDKADYFLDPKNKLFQNDISEILNQHKIDTIINLWPVYDKSPDVLLEETLKDEQYLSYGSVLNSTKALSTDSTGLSPRMIVVSNGVYKVEEKDNINLTHSTIVGLMRVIHNEIPSLPLCHVDVSTDVTDEEVDLLVQMIFSDSQEDEIAIRNQQLYAHRFERTQTKDTIRGTQDNTPYALVQKKIGDYKSLELNLTSHNQLLPDEVEINVHATGINFKDFMKLVELLPEQVMEDNYWQHYIGMECSGVVTRIGKNVKDFKTGNKVLAFSRNSFRKYVTTDSTLVFNKPENLSYEQAAAIPLTYLTAYYALKHVANLKQGDTVLIHSAAGGIGHAAIEIASSLGANIIATAGSEVKRQYLKNSGINHVFDSRNLSFCNDVLSITSGRGVDVVINSTASEFLQKSFELLNESGQFIELGKIDIVNNNNLSMRPFDKNLSFNAIDIDRLLNSAPERMNKVFSELLTLLANNTINPPPITCFSADEAVTAFETMKNAEHIGKLVLTFPDSYPLEKAQSILIDINGSYLITGGLGGFGLQVALWLNKHGVRHLILQGRSGIRTTQQQETVDYLNKMGTKVSIIKGDIGDQEHVKELIQKSNALAPLKGIFHAAAILDDALISEQDMERFFNVMHSKMMGAWYLHKHSLNLDLDYFINFSSIVAAIGNRGSCNYCAANTFVDALSYYRRDISKSALSVNWGLIANVGMATTEETIRKKLEAAGLLGMHTQSGLTILDRFINQPDLSQVAIAELNWSRWKKHNGASKSPRFEAILGKDTDVENSKKISALELAKDMPIEQQEAFLASQVAQTISPIIKLQAEDVPIATPLVDLGIDSLMALEIRVALETLGIQVSMAYILRGTSINNIVAGQLKNIRKDIKTSIKTIESSKKGSYLRYFHKNDKAKYRMFCFPYAGASSSVYYSWSKVVSESDQIEIVSIALPGRGERLGEETSPSVYLVANEIATEMLNHLDKPYILFGHCLGSIIMYEVAKKLKAAGKASADLMVVCAAAAPDLYLSPVVHTQSDDKFLEILNLLDFTNTRAIVEDKEFREVIFPTLRTDFEAVLGYNNSETKITKLDMPIITIGAERDLFAAPDAVTLWKQYTNKDCCSFTLDTHHYFIETHRDYLLGKILNWTDNRDLKSLPNNSHDFAKEEVSHENAYGKAKVVLQKNINPSGKGRIILLTKELGTYFCRENNINLTDYQEVISVQLADFEGDGYAYTQKMLNLLCSEIKNLDKKDTVVWGHGFGAVMAYELLARLNCSRHGIKHLIVSGAASPNCYVMPKAHLVDNKKQSFLLKVIDHPHANSHKNASPGNEISNAFELSCSYAFAADFKQLPVAITAIRLRDDLWTYYHGMEQWEKFTNNEFLLIDVKGNHFHLKPEDADMFLKHIGAEKYFSSKPERMEEIAL